MKPRVVAAFFISVRTLARSGPVATSAFQRDVCFRERCQLLDDGFHDLAHIPGWAVCREHHCHLLEHHGLGTVLFATIKRI